MGKGERGGNVLPGDVAWRLFDTYGFPLDLTQLMAEEQNLEASSSSSRIGGIHSWLLTDGFVSCVTYDGSSLFVLDCPVHPFLLSVGCHCSCCFRMCVHSDNPEGANVNNFDPSFYAVHILLFMPQLVFLTLDIIPITNNL